MTAWSLYAQVMYCYFLGVGIAVYQNVTYIYVNKHKIVIPVCGVYACVFACMRACLRVCVRVCVCAYVYMYEVRMHAFGCTCKDFQYMNDRYMETESFVT